jgi:hypothetical protein
VSRAAAQSLGRIVLVAFLLVTLLALLTTARHASTRRARRPPASAVKPVKGDVRRTEDGTLLYYDGREWTSTPPRPNDDAF